MFGINKFKNVPVDLNKLTNVAKKRLLKRLYDKSVKKVMVI